MKEILMEYLPKIVEYALIIIVGLLANKAKKLINTDIKRNIVKDTVKYVEQVFNDVHGGEKLNLAIEKATELLRAKGIKIDESEIVVLIESAVSEMNRNDSALNKLIETLEVKAVDEVDKQNRDGDS